MDLITAESTLLLAFSLGMFHALDADHIMAVSALTAKRPTAKSCIKFCYHWATGHGLALLAIALSVFVFGLAIPSALSGLAESLVGALLIVIGSLALWDIGRRGLYLSFHHHEPDINHVHWHQQNHNKKQDHSALLVGILHGTAGSAPLLILIPVSNMGSALDAMGYVLLFALGVIVSMLIFGGLLAHSYKKLARWGDKMVAAIRALVACSAIGFGSYLLYGYF
jgi:ABC-type nickel/cobalt efflux system permease component RcnA